MAPEDVLSLIDTIYECVDAPEQWGTALARLSDLMHSGGTQLLVTDLTTGAELIGATARIPIEAHIEYMRDYYQDDLRVRRLMTLPIGTIIDERGVLTEAEIRTSAVINELEPRYELANLIGSNLMIGDKYCWLGTARGTAPRPYDEAELRTLATVLPHIRRAVRLSLELASNDALTGVLGNLHARAGRAVIVMDLGGRVGFVNPYATHLAEGGLFALRGNVVEFSDRRAQTEFRRIVFAYQNTRGNVGSSNFLVQGALEEQFGVRVLRHLGSLPEAGLPTGDKLVVTIVPLSGTIRPTDHEIARFGALFALTAAEARVVVAVAHDVSLSNYATDGRLALDTVRKHLKSVLTKTGCRSQKQLVRKIERFCFLVTQ